MNISDESGPSHTRRGFLSGFFGLVTGTIAIAANCKATPADITSPDTTAQTSQGYRLSEHIQKYYDKTRF